ncbi:phospholipid phosphatase-related protein type 5a isoform X4 [Paramormyrops kingsleyae]|uniref:phospholipid phosphatase-related protein type 5a isoform X4 n=1 Tax=Paramormyrops kingsleyae TaxID=1676925 RepID=UPI003B96C1DA
MRPLGPSSSPKARKHVLPLWPRRGQAPMLSGTSHQKSPTISATESVFFLLQYVSEDVDNREKITVMGDCCYLNPLVRRTFRFLGVYAFGLFATDIFVNAGQVVTGNLAPHFLTVCKPNYTALGCQQAALFISQQGACTGNEEDVLRARKSFPSKEAALSVYAALYVSMYITCSVKAKGTRLAKPVLSLGLMCLALLAGINRVVEYRNHWSDVIAGFIVGGAIATFMVVGVLQKFKGKPLLSEIPHEGSITDTPAISRTELESPGEKYAATQNPITFAEVT